MSIPDSHWTPSQILEASGIKVAAPTPGPSTAGPPQLDFSTMMNRLAGPAPRKPPLLTGSTSQAGSVPTRISQIQEYNQHVQVISNLLAQTQSVDKAWQYFCTNLAQLPAPSQISITQENLSTLQHLLQRVCEEWVSLELRMMTYQPDSTRLTREECQLPFGSLAEAVSVLTAAGAILSDGFELALKTVIGVILTTHSPQQVDPHGRLVRQLIEIWAITMRRLVGPTDSEQPGNRQGPMSFRPYNHTEVRKVASDCSTAWTLPSNVAIDARLYPADGPTGPAVRARHLRERALAARIVRVFPKISTVDANGLAWLLFSSFDILTASLPDTSLGEAAQRIQSESPTDEAGNDDIGFEIATAAAEGLALEAVGPDVLPLVKFAAHLIQGSAPGHAIESIDSLLRQLEFDGAPTSLLNDWRERLSSVVRRALIVYGSSDEHWSLPSSESAPLDVLYEKRVMECGQRGAIGKLEDLWQIVLKTYTIGTGSFTPPPSTARSKMESSRTESDIQQSDSAVDESEPKTQPTQVVHGGKVPERLSHAFLRAFAKHGQFSSAGAVWDEMVRTMSADDQPSLAAWSALIIGCRQARWPAGVTNALNEMDRRGIELDGPIYTSAIYTLFAYGNPEMALRLVERLTVGWVKHVSSDESVGQETRVPPSPTVLTLNAALAGVLQNRDLNRETKWRIQTNLFEWASSLNINRDITTFNTLLNHSVINHDLDRSMNILSQMEQERISPDTITFTTLSRLVFGPQTAIDPSNLGDAAIRFISEIESRNVIPSSHLFATLVHGLLSQHSNVTAAQQVLTAMRQRCHRPSVHIYTAVLSYHIDIAGPGGLIDMTAVESVWETALADGISPDAVLYGRLISAYSRSGMTAAMERFVQRAVRDGIRLGWGSMKDILLARLAVADRRAALELVRDVRLGEGLARYVNRQIDDPTTPAVGTVRRQFWDLVRQYGLE